MADIRAIDQGVLNRIASEIGQLNTQQAQIGMVVDRVQTHQFEMDNRLQALATQFSEYLEADRRAKELQLAETRIVKVRQELETTYGHYADVRRRAVGILQAIDVGVVTHETIQGTTEDVMMAAPRYWLAPALVALAGWARDDRPLAERALGEALARDVDKVALFFALVLRRSERPDSSARWLGHFFARQDPTALSRELVVLLDAVATGAFGPQAKAIVGLNIQEWIDTLTAAEGFLPEQHGRWREALLALTPQVADTKYKTLSTASPTWGALRDSLAAVQRNQHVLVHFQRIFEGELQVPRDIEEHIDELLDSLVERFDPEELPLREREAELQAIIDWSGDRDAALQRFESTRQALAEQVDFMGLLTNAAMHAQEAGASRGTQRLAVAMSRPWIVAAHDELVATARHEAPASIELAVDDWSATVDGDSSEDDLLADLRRHFDASTQAAVDAVKFRGGPLVAAIAAPVVALTAIAAPFLLVIAAGLAAWAIYSYTQLQPRRAAAREEGEKRKENAEAWLRNSLTEYVDYRAEWERCDRQAEDVRALLTSIAADEYALAREDDVRTVIA